jgi:hypothetical protein
MVRLAKKGQSLESDRFLYRFKLAEDFLEPGSKPFLRLLSLGRGRLLW